MVVGDENRGGGGGGRRCYWFRSFLDKNDSNHQLGIAMVRTKWNFNKKKLDIECNINSGSTPEPVLPPHCTEPIFAVPKRHFSQTNHIQ